MKRSKKIIFLFIRILLFFFISVLVFGILSTLVLLIGLNLQNTFDLISKISNPNAMIFDIVKLNFKHIFGSFSATFLFMIPTLMLVALLLDLVEKTFKIKLLHHMRYLVLYFMPIFLTLFLIIWLDETNFNIVTSIISFAALLFPLTTKALDDKTPSNDKHDNVSQSQ